MENSCVHLQQHQCNIWSPNEEKGHQFNLLWDQCILVILFSIFMSYSKSSANGIVAYFSAHHATMQQQTHCDVTLRHTLGCLKQTKFVWCHQVLTTSMILTGYIGTCNVQNYYTSLSKQYLLNTIELSMRDKSKNICCCGI